MIVNADDVLTYPVLKLGGDGAVTSAVEPQGLHEMTRRAAEGPYARKMKICDVLGRLFEVKTVRIDRLSRRTSWLFFSGKIFWVDFEVELVGSVDVVALKEMVRELMRNEYPNGYARLFEDPDILREFEAAADVPQLIAFFTPVSPQDGKP